MAREHPRIGDALRREFLHHARAHRLRVEADAAGRAGLRVAGARRTRRVLRAARRLATGPAAPESRGGATFSALSCAPGAPRPAPSAPAASWSVRSTFSGVMDTWPCGRGVEIGSFGVVLGRPGAADPVHGLAMRAGLRNHLLGRMAPPQAAHLERLEFFVRQVRDVDVEQPGLVGAARAREHLLHQLARLAGRGVDVGPALLRLRERDGRDAEQVAFHRGAHGARVDGVVAHVGAVVDAAHDQVGPIAEQARSRPRARNRPACR